MRRRCDKNRANGLMKGDAGGGLEDSGDIWLWDDVGKWTQKDMRNKKGGGREGEDEDGEDSLAYAGMVHWAFLALLFYLTLFSLLLFSRNIWVGGREGERERKRKLQ